MYDVSKYTDEELYNILDMNNPTDRELEAKILSLVNKYSHFGNEDGDKLTQFFIDIYNRFFEDDRDDAEQEPEGFTPNIPEYVSNKGVQTNAIVSKRFDSQSRPTTFPQTSGQDLIVTDDLNYNTGVLNSSITNGEYTSGNMGLYRTSDPPTGTLGRNPIQLNQQSTAISSASRQDAILTKTLEYKKGTINPILKETIKRIISIDSQYRDNKSVTSTTNFTFNLSEPLRDVVSLKLYSIQIPYTWYTVNSSYGGNFLYIKGNSPGIDNSDHYYKVSISSGNYTPQSLVDSVNTSLKNIKFSDSGKSAANVNFGKTGIAYNAITGKSVITLDIKHIYDESNYYLKFPDWTGNMNTPINTTPDRFSSLATYFGYNNTIYPGSQINSSFISGQSGVRNPTFTVTAENSVFYIYPYIGNSYYNGDYTKVYPRVTVSIGKTGSITRSQLISDLNGVLKQAPYHFEYSGVYWINVSDNRKLNNGDSYINMQIKFDPYNSPQIPLIENLKFAIVFPNVSDPIFYRNPSSTQTVSAFEFPNTYKDSGENVVCELNNIIAESPIMQSNYNVAGTTQLRYVCITTGYGNIPLGSDRSLNDFWVNISPFNGKRLSEYITTVNNAITSTSPYLNGTIMVQNADFKISIQTQIKKTFTNADYTLVATGEIAKIFGIDPGNVEPGNTLSTPYSDFSNNYVLNSVKFTEFDTLIIKPKYESDNKFASEITVVFEDDTAYNSIESLISYLNRKLTTFTDDFGKSTFQNSSIFYDDQTSTYHLYVNVTQTLTPDDYVLVMYSSELVNSWENNLKFEESYQLKEFANTNYVVTNLYPISTNQIIIPNDASYNYIELIPYETINGLNPITNDYKIRVYVPPKNYSILEIFTVINAAFENNPITKGSAFTSITPPDSNGKSYTQLRLNINKIFNTTDYRVSFYDPVSFVNCYVGASRKGNKTITNAAWDTTIGWLLGFRNSIVYNMIDYNGITDIEELVYEQFDTTSNNIQYILTGDTAVNTNLYNYFLIYLDDYVQNHLNDGLVTIINQETSLKHLPVKYICDPVTNEQITVPADYGSPGITYTNKQLYSFNQQVLSQQVKDKSISSGPFVQDIFAIIPIKTAGLTLGSTYIEFGGTLQNQDRLYFGPVNIHRMTIRLLNDRGDLVDLNNANWSFSLVCEQLYKDSNNT